MAENKILTIGLTGSNSFLGSSLANKLASDGNYIISLDSIVHPDKAEADIELPDSLDWVLHFGATKSIEASFKNPCEIYRRNLHSTIKALEIALLKNARLLYMSSYVYGKAQYLPIDENHPTSVRNPYMGSKLLGEQLCGHFHQIMNLSVIILRGFTLYGPCQKGDQLIPSIIESIKTQRPILVKDPIPKRDYLYVDDFTRLIDLIIQSDFSGFEIYNLGGGKLYSNLEVAEMANRLTEHPVPLHTEGTRRKNDVLECCANLTKIKKDFCWEPEVDLHSGLLDCLSC